MVPNAQFGIVQSRAVVSSYELLADAARGRRAGGMHLLFRAAMAFIPGRLPSSSAGRKLRSAIEVSL